MQNLQAEINVLDDLGDQMDFISSPSEIMEQRYQNVLQHTIPSFDNLTDKNQDLMAPEYSQIIYKNALCTEKVVGDYFAASGHVILSSPAHRKEMIYLIEILSH